MTKDIQIYDTTDGGEIDPKLIAEYPIASAAYLSLFGGNAQDDGSANNSATWWGNLLESDPNYKQVSKTQYALASLNLTPLNLHKFKANALADLNWIIALGIAETLDVVVTIPALNSIHFEITVDGVIILEQTYNAAAGGATDDTDTPIGNIVAPPTNLAYDANTMALTGNSALPSVTIHIYDENLVLLDTYQVVPVDGAFSLDVSTYPSGTYCANAFATDSSGASSVTTACIEFTHVLFNAPYNLAGVYDRVSVSLSWTSGGDQEYFNVYRDGDVIATGVTGTVFEDTTAQVWQEYEYTVVAVAMGVSKFSDPITVSTDIPFNAPYNLAGGYAASVVNLTWASDDEQDYFDVYRGNVLIATGLTAKSYVDNGVTSGMNYTYKVASVVIGVSKYSDPITVSTVLADPYWSSVDYLIMPSSGVIVDKSTHNRTITNSNVTIVNNEMYFNGTNAGLTFTAAALNALDHTFEFFLNIPLTVGSASTEMIWRLGTTGDYLSYTTTGDTLTLVLQGVGTLSLGSVTRGTKQHFCFERSGATVYGFRNGVLTGSIAAHSTTITAINVGKQGTDFPLKGTISQMRMTLGVARYATTGFTPPTSFPVVV